MATTIAILNQKGGVGKTTISMNLVRALTMKGENALLVDSDPQGSARDWHAAGDGEKVQAVGLDRKTLDKDIKGFSGAYDWIVIDGAPQLADLAVAAIRAADVVLIPVQPSPLDIWSTSDLVDAIKARQEITDGRPKAAFVISRSVVGTNIGKEAAQALAEYELPVFKSRTTQRVAYTEAPASGSTVLDTDPKGKAAEEIWVLLREVRRFVNGR